MFITRLLAEGRATADAAATLLVLHHLAHQADPAQQAQQAQPAQQPQQAQQAGASRLVSPEEAFVAVLQTADLQGGRNRRDALKCIVDSLYMLYCSHTAHIRAE